MEKALKYKRDQPSPKMRREKRMELGLYLFFFLLIALITALTVISVASIYKPSNQILVDYDTREIKGEYQTTLFRTTDEMINGGIRWLEYYLSLNSGTIERDTYISLMMMSEEKRNERRDLIKKTNHVNRVKSANAKARVEVDKTNIKVIVAKGSQMKIEYKGNVVIDSSTVVNDKRVPFHLVVDLLMVGITMENTSGVEVVDYHEYGASDAFK